jgi:hypothetical protein
MSFIGEGADCVIKTGVDVAYDVRPKALEYNDILLCVFNDVQKHALPMRLRELGARYRSDPHGVVDMHSMVGLCKTFGLHGMLAELESFRTAPSEVGMASLWSVMETTRQRLQSGMHVSVVPGRSAFD